MSVPLGFPRAVGAAHGHGTRVRRYNCLRHLETGDVDPRHGYRDGVTPSPAARRRAVVAVLAVYLAGVARLTLWPEPAPDDTFDLVRAVLGWLQDRGFPVTYAGTEAVANVVLFVPFGLLVGWLLRRAWWAVALAAATSTAIELVQRTMPSRVPTVQDVVLNTLGAVVGVAVLLLARRGARTRTGRALPEEDPARAGG